jgi:molybdate transport system regulatory protein
MTRRATSPRLGVQGLLWLTAGDENIGGHGRMALLRAVAEQGSITRAARAFGMSYKAAWDAIDTMNRVAGEPLVARSTGGRGGGSTRLTPRGERLLVRFAEVEGIHRRFIDLLAEQAVDLDQEFPVLKAVNLRTSARNQFAGMVSALRPGAVNDEVEITLPGGLRLVAIITSDSTRSLGLRAGQPAMALVQAAGVVLATGLDGNRVSARNQLPGVVRAINPGAVNTEVLLDLDGGPALVAMVSEAGARSLGIDAGTRVTALVDASAVIVAVAA